MAERKSFIFYKRYWEAVEHLRPKQKLLAIEAIIEYSLYGDTPMLHGENYGTTAYNAFVSVKPIIELERRIAVEGRQCAEYKQWRRSVFERDGFRCQICSKRSGKLNAHHIKKYAYYPELRYSVSNGITLCEECHKAVHRERGGFRGMD